jgi:excisionase family DNA binding protein
MRPRGLVARRLFVATDLVRYHPPAQGANTVKKPVLDVARLAYSPNEAAQALSISVPTIHRALGAGLIRHSRLGRLVRIPVAEVDRVAAEGLPAIPRYVRKTTGPTKQGRPRKAVPVLQRRVKPAARRKADDGPRVVP